MDRQGEQQKDYYELLGVARRATREEIREAYKEIARVYHPDSQFYSEIVGKAVVSEDQISIFKQITDAYNTLMNEERRKEYDKAIGSKIPQWGETLSDWSVFDKKSTTLEQPQLSFAFGKFGNVKTKKSEEPKEQERAAKPAPEPETPRVSEMLRRRKKTGFIGRLLRGFK